jgi:hypothetical protein
LKRCRPEAADPGCPRGLRCISSSTSGGACVPVAATCHTSDDCTSTIFNACFNQGELAVGEAPDAGAAVTSYCLQSGCVSNDTACSPGSTCIRKVLPEQISAPDICAPDCNHDLECPPNMVCAHRALPASGAHICIPDFYGFPCKGAYSCVSGECSVLINASTGLSGAQLPPISVCASDCATTADCPDTSTSTPDPYSVQTCRGEKCESLFGLTGALTCFAAGRACGGGLGTCQELKFPSPPPPDGGVGPCAALGVSASAPPFCARECGSDADCAPLEAALGLPLTCLQRAKIEALGYPTSGFLGFLVYGDPPHDALCVPRAPGLPCDGDASCLPGLACKPARLPGGTHAICTKDCAASGRCDTDDGGFNMGPGYACGSAIAPGMLDPLCYPKVPSGQPAPIAPLCMSGMLGPDPRAPNRMVCLSGPGLACDSDWQCKSASCLKIPQCNPHGHCE